MKTRIVTACLPLLLTATALLAGPRLGIHSLVARSDAIAVVQVRFRDTAPPVVEIRQWLLPAKTPNQPPDTHATDWTGYCLPDRPLLHRWVQTHAHLGGLPLWQQALADGGYESVVYLRQRQGKLKPMCESETLLARHWTAHPGYAGYRQRLARAIAKKTEGLLGFKQ